MHAKSHDRKKINAKREYDSEHHIDDISILGGKSDVHSY